LRLLWAWQHFATDPLAANDSWALFFEDDCIFHPDLRGDRARVEAILGEAFDLAQHEGFAYLGLCGMKAEDAVRRSWAADASEMKPCGHGSRASSRGWREIHGPHGTLYLHVPTNTYSSHAPGSAGSGFRAGTKCATVHAAHGVEYVKGCGTCLHAYGVSKWRAATLWSELETIPWPDYHPLTEEPDMLTLDAYLFHAMVSGVLPMVWNVGANLTRDPGDLSYRGMLYQDAELPGGILY